MTTSTATIMAAPEWTDGRAIPAGQAWLGFLFAVTGALIATSIFSIGDSGVPLYFLMFLVPVGAVVLGLVWSKRSEISRRTLGLLIATAAIFLLVSLATYFQYALNIQSPGVGLSHAIVRLSYLVYFAVCVTFLRGGILVSCVRWLRRILAVVAIYGIYQVPAKLLGMPLFLDWLRNNHSFGLYDYSTSGWVALMRANSVYAEPSQCAIPLLVLCILNVYVPAPRFSKAIVWLAVFPFALLTFSRSAWVALLALGIVLAILKFVPLENPFKRHRLFAGFILFAIAALFPLWTFLRSNYRSDLSRQERAGSVVIGLHIAAEHPFIGSGWGSFKTLVPAYQLNLEGANPEIQFKFIHNMFVSYAEQAGIPGFLFVLFPFYAMLFASEGPLSLRLASVIPMLALAEIGSYESLVWLWAAILVNWGHMFEPVTRMQTSTDRQAKSA